MKSFSITEVIKNLNIRRAFANFLVFGLFTIAFQVQNSVF